MTNKNDIDYISLDKLELNEEETEQYTNLKYLEYAIRKESVDNSLYAIQTAINELAKEIQTIKEKLNEEKIKWVN